MLTVEDLRTFIETPRGMVRCVNGISLTVAQGETLGLVGESGSGKTMTAMSIMGMVDEFPGIVSGRIAFANGDPSRPLELTDDLDRHITLHENGHKEVRLKKSWREWRTISNRRYRPLWGSKISMVFQDPLSSLNPYWTIGEQLEEAIKIGAGTEKLTVRQFADQALGWLDQVGIQTPTRVYHAYPHELSGGMGQRAMIAVALASRPELLIADEPTTGLDVTVQVRIIELLKRLRSDLGMSMLLISHDIGLIGQMSDRIAVMYCGEIVEAGPAEAVLYGQEGCRHPYTEALLASLPPLEHLEAGSRLPVIANEVPDMLAPPSGCSFHSRCEVYTADRNEACVGKRPTPFEADPGHQLQCHQRMGYSNGG